MTPETQPLMLTVPQVAKLLQVREETVRVLIRAGKMPAKRFSLDGGIRVSRIALEEWSKEPADYSDTVSLAR